MGVLYRPNVAGILRNSKGKILVCERVGKPGAWQFPQGGIDEGETPREALYRELEEEISLSPAHYKIIEERGGYRYQFTEGRLKFGIYGGQEQTYFLCDFLGKDKHIQVDTDHPEFQLVRWINPKAFPISGVPQFKRQVYQQIFRDFFGVQFD